MPSLLIVILAGAILTAASQFQEAATTFESAAKSAAEVWDCELRSRQNAEAEAAKRNFHDAAIYLKALDPSREKRLAAAAASLESAYVPEGANTSVSIRWLAQPTLQWTFVAAHQTNPERPRTHPNWWIRLREGP